MYSTEHGKMCPGCGRPDGRCTCRQKREPVFSADGTVRVGRETRGRRGKEVTVISGLPIDHDGLRDLARLLKQRCGSGGTIKEGVIEIQGDHRELLVLELRKQGWNVKPAGG